MSTQTLTHSRLSCFRACPRRHYLRYELGVRREETSFAVRVGSAFHAALDADAKGLDVESAIEAIMDDPFDMALVAAMLTGHRNRWSGREIEVVASELAFDLPVRNPETGAATPIWTLAGVIDRIVRLPDGRLALMEYKTTSRDFTPGADYWMRLHLDQQLSIYVIAARELGYDIETVLYDVTKRPQHRPLKATPEDKRKYKQDGTLYANQRAEDETPEAFAARVATAIDEGQDRYFARIEIARLDQDLEDCAAEVWQQQRSVREAQRMERWYRNPGACFEPFACDYLSICQNRNLEHDTPEGFVRVEEIHPELAAHAANGG